LLKIPIKLCGVKLFLVLEVENFFKLSEDCGTLVTSDCIAVEVFVLKLSGTWTALKSSLRISKSVSGC